MAFVKVSANLKLDNPHIDGLLTKLGFGREWKATVPALGDRWSADLAEGYGWFYNSSVRYVEGLQCLTPKGVPGTYSMYPTAGYYRREGAGDTLKRLEIKTHLTIKESNQTVAARGWSSYVDINFALGGLGSESNATIIINSGKWVLSPSTRQYNAVRRIQLIGKTVGDTGNYNNYEHIGDFTTVDYYRNIRFSCGYGPPVIGSNLNEFNADINGGGILIEYLPNDAEDTGGADPTTIALFIPRLTEDSVDTNQELFFDSLTDPYNSAVIQTTTLMAKTAYDKQYKILTSFDELNLFSSEEGEIILDIEWIDDHIVLTSYNKNTITNALEVGTQITYAPEDFTFKNTLNQDCLWTTINGRKIKVTAIGSSYSIDLQELTYNKVAGITLKPTTYTKVPADISYTPIYTATLNKTTQYPGLKPGTLCCAVDYYRTDLEYDDDGDITSGTINYDKSRPILTLYTSKNTPACFYGISEFRTATLTAGSSTLVQTQDNNNMRLQKVSGVMDDSWQNHSIDIEIESFTGTIPNTEPNCKVILDVSLDGVTEYRHFTGYLTGDYTKESINDAREQSILRLNAQDPINARLNNKLIYWQGAFDGMDCTTAFEYILNCAGVPDSMIVVEEALLEYSENNVGTMHNLIIPMNKKRGIKNYLFTPETKVPDVITALVDACGGNSTLMWGTDVYGRYCLKTKPTYIHGVSTIDFTIDEDTLTESDICFSFSRSENYEDFANVFIIIGGHGWSSDTRLYINGANINIPTSPNFYGDVKYKFEWIDNENSVLKTMAKAVREADDNIHRIYFELHNQPALSPDDYVKVQVNSGLDITTNSVYRIVNKSYSLDCMKNEYIQQLEAVLVYVPSS